MPILPVIDLLIFSAWSVLSVGAVLKAISITTQYRPTVLTLGPFDCLVLAAVLLLFALALAGRAWVKANEAAGVQARARQTLDAYTDAYTAAQQAAQGDENGEREADTPERMAAGGS